MKRLLLLSFLLGSFTTHNVTAQGLTAVRPLPGYRCMRLNLTREQMMDRSLEVPVYSAPSRDSVKVGEASAILFVKNPLHAENGYVEILFPDGRPAWIAKGLLSPFATAANPKANCTPSLMSNGKPGFTTSSD